MEYVIKRDGTKVPFDKSKIVNAIEKAMTCTPGGIDARVSNAIADYIADMPDILSVEQIQDIVVDSLKNSPFSDVAEAYSQWRKYRQEIREKEKTNASILDIIDIRNDAINQENSNKNPTVNSVQRDYMAGEVSKDITKRFLLPPDIVDAHEQGLIHFHDADYFAQHMHNCCLVNLEDMLQNGTVISETMIDKPKSFEMLLVASQNRWEDCQDNGIVCAAMPIKVNDLVSTIEMMLQAQIRRRRKLRSQPRKRSPEEQKIIDDAKHLLMERNNMSEQEAFRYIQKCSMDSGNTMVESATMVMGIYQDV